MFIFIIAGVVLSTLHQSSLGTLMVIAGSKMHPLWQTPVLPLLFLLSAIAVGFPMVIFESLLASRSFGLKPEMDVLSRLGGIVAPILGIYLAFKLGDMFIRETFVYLMEPNTAERHVDHRGCARHYRPAADVPFPRRAEVPGPDFHRIGAGHPGRAPESLSTISSWRILLPIPSGPTSLPSGRFP